MGATIILADFKGKTWTKEEPRKTEPAIDLALIEREIALSLWGQDAGTIGIYHYHEDKDPA